MKVSDLIALADSLRPEVYLTRGELTRKAANERDLITIPFDLRLVMLNDPVANILLEPQDQVVIHDIAISRRADEFVEVFGSVKKPGRYQLSTNMTLSDLLMLADGFTEDAWTQQAEIARVDREYHNDTLITIKIAGLPNLQDSSKILGFTFFEEYRSQDLRLQHRDQIFIRTDPNFNVQRLVTVSGEVVFPGTYSMQKKGDRISDIIKRAGGITPEAHLKAGRLNRNGDRVITDLEMAIAYPNTSYDIILQTGDNISIPRKSHSVWVLGEVNNPGIMGFVEGNTIWDYIDMSGGLKDSSDYIILTHPTGFSERFRTGWFGGDTDVYEGSIITVTKVPSPVITKKEMDVGNLIRDIFAIAASALTILVLSRQL